MRLVRWAFKENLWEWVLEENQCKISPPTPCRWLGQFSFQNTWTWALPWTKPRPHQWDFTNHSAGRNADLLAREVFRGPVVLVRSLFTPALTCMSRYSDGHRPPIALSFALQTLICWARGGWWCRLGVIHYNEYFYSEECTDRCCRGMDAGNIFCSSSLRIWDLKIVYYLQKKLTW